MSRDAWTRAPSAHRHWRQKRGSILSGMTAKRCRLQARARSRTGSGRGAGPPHRRPATRSYGGTDPGGPATISRGDQSTPDGPRAGLGETALSMATLRRAPSTDPSAGAGRTQPHPDRVGQVAVDAAQPPARSGKAQALQALGAQALLRLLAHLEGDETDLTPAAQKVDGRVVAGLAHGDRGCGEQGAELGSSPLDDDIGERSCRAKKFDFRHAHARRCARGADKEACRERRGRAAGSRRSIRPETTFPLGPVSLWRRPSFSST